MIKERGRVLRIDGSGVWVETLRQSTCGACQARHGCGQRLLNQIGASTSLIRAECDAGLMNGLVEGDWVEVGVEEGAVVLGSLLAYGLPILLLVLGAGLGGPSSLSSVGGALAGMAAGSLISRYVLSKHVGATYFQARVLDRITADKAISVAAP